MTLHAQTVRDCNESGSAWMNVAQTLLERLLMPVRRLPRQPE